MKDMNETETSKETSATVQTGKVPGGLEPDTLQPVTALVKDSYYLKM